MTVSCEWMVLCEQVLMDQQTGSISLLNCLDVLMTRDFPASHPRFAFSAMYRTSGEEPGEVSFRFLRLSEVDGDEELATLGGPWPPGQRTSRVFVNFHHLRLRRAETVRFRVDHRVAGGRWVKGPVREIDVLAAPPS